MKLLVIAAVWPEPNSSAAGTRMMSLLKLFKKQQWDITFACTASDSSHSYPLANLDIQSKHIEVNNDTFDTFASELQPDIVLYDRFMIEEQFSWRIDQHCPNALTLLETSDLHCLRQARQNALKQDREFTSDDLNGETAYREIASILRTDISLIISKYELQLLQDTFHISPLILHYLPFLHQQEQQQTDAWPSFEQREGFISIGNFKHAPNWDSVQYLKTEIWPRIREKLPKANLYIYGAYPPPKATQLNAPKQGFNIKGWADDANIVMQNVRLCLAPLRFGAGLKGKLLDAMINGTPSITSSIGAEAMHSNLAWNGIISDNPDEYANAAIELYQNKLNWQQCQKNGLNILERCYQPAEFEDQLINKISSTQQNLVSHRTQNIYSGLLKYHAFKSSKYMSLWITEKNKKNG